MKSKITKIISEGFFASNNIGEIIIKGNDQAIISIIIDDSFDLKKAEQETKKIEEAIKENLDIKKVTIFLTSDQKNAKTKTEKTKPSLKEKIGKFFHQDQKNSDGVHKENVKDDAQQVAKKKQSSNHKKIPNVKKIIAVASAKGGVGKSTIAANLAYSFKKTGHKVAIVDADIYGPSIAYLMGSDEKPINKGGKIIPLQQDGIKFISVANLIKKDEAGVWRAAMINKILNQILLQTDWGHDNQDVDLMIIDMPPGTGDIYLSVAQNFEINGAVLVSTPQSLSQIDLVRSIDCFNKLQVPIIGMVENMSYYTDSQGQEINIFGESSLQKLADENKIQILAKLAIDPTINSMQQGQIICKELPNSKISHQIGMISEEIAIRL